MKRNSLAARNRHLKKDTSGETIVRNAATSTAIETGKDSNVYITGYTHSGKTAVTRNKKLRK